MVEPTHHAEASGPSQEVHEVLLGEHERERINESHSLKAWLWGHRVG